MKPCLLFIQLPVWKAWGCAAMCFFLELTLLIENVHGHSRTLGGLTHLDSIKQPFSPGQTEVKLDKPQTRNKGASRNHQIVSRAVTGTEWTCISNKGCLFWAKVPRVQNWIKNTVESLNSTQRQYTISVPKACLWNKTPGVWYWLHQWLVCDFGQPPSLYLLIY